MLSGLSSKARTYYTNAWFNGHDIGVPQIDWSLTSPELLVMEWLHGQPLLMAAIPAPEEGLTHGKTFPHSCFVPFPAVLCWRIFPR